jgi:hypothetical protein
MQKIINLFRRLPPVGQRVAVEVWFPFIVTLGWFVLTYLQQQRSLYESAAAGAGAFFFTFFLQGQYLRMKKNVRDDQNADEWKDSFALVIAEIRGQKAGPLVAAGAERPARFRMSGDELVGEARENLDKGSRYGAMLLAAVGFETSLRRFGAMFDVNPKKPLTRILTELEPVLEDSKLIARLRLLTRLRNGLVHAQFQKPTLDRADADATITAFEDGVGRMSATASARF